MKILPDDFSAKTHRVRYNRNLLSSHGYAPGTMDVVRSGGSRAGPTYVTKKRAKRLIESTEVDRLTGVAANLVDILLSEAGEPEELLRIANQYVER